MCRHLLIGGVDLVIDTGPVSRLEHGDPFSRRFLSADAPAAVPGLLQVPLSLSLEPGPDTGKLPMLFDTGASWAAYAGEGGQDEVVLELRAPGGGFLWRAALREGPPQVTVYCGPQLVSEPEPAAIVLTSPLHYPLDQLLLAYLLAPRQGLVVHAAGVALHGRGLIMAGVSGAGKTTVMRLLAGHAPLTGHEMLTGLSDDRVVLRRVAGKDLVFGTPWAGEGQVADAGHAPLAAILLLHKAEVAELRPIPTPLAVRQLLPATSILWYDQDRMTRQLGFLDQLVQQVPVYELHFPPTPRAAELVLQLLAD